MLFGVSLLLGLFDRPADAGCLKALWKASAIPDLTEPLVGMSEAHRNLAFTRLQDAKLLTVNWDTAGALLVLDAHPLLREYFARELREQRPEAWRAAHRRLYEHLCATTKDKAQPSCPRSKTGELHLIVDSTGLKLRGVGEWLFVKHGTSKRRSWRKLHIGIDAFDGENRKGQKHSRANQRALSRRFGLAVPLAVK